MHIHIHIHDHRSDGYMEKILQKINLLNTKNDHFMANTQERFDALMARLDKVTTDIAGDYKTLLDEVKAGTVSDDSFTKAEANIAKLEALGASVDNPVPSGDGGTGDTTPPTTDGSGDASQAAQ